MSRHPLALLIIALSIMVTVVVARNHAQVQNDWTEPFPAFRIAGNLYYGLGCDYSNLKRHKTNSDHDFNSEYREEIAKTLQQITGENFGVDQKRWALWLDQQKAE